jgi:glycerophosphoryl diester phosphodiesterase
VTSPRPLIIGHRGASGYRPEHTRASYELAFALGADAVEPDIVATLDGELVLRHENEISTTTDVARHPEFAARRTTKVVDGNTVTGWFTEDFTWAELSTLRTIERLPQLRQHSATFDGRYPILRLRELLELIDAASERHGRALGLVAEIKHPTHFAALDLPLGELVAQALSGWADADRLVVESFEQSVLGELRGRGIPGRYIYLLEAKGAAADLAALLGTKAPSYSSQLGNAGLARLATEVDGISVDRSRLLKVEAGAAVVTDLVSRAHASGLAVFAWTLRPENRFLTAPFRRGAKSADWGDWRAEFRMLLDSGLDGAFFDHPDLGVALRDEA